MSEGAAGEDRGVSDATHRWTGRIGEQYDEEYQDELSTSYLSRKLTRQATKQAQAEWK